MSTVIPVPVGKETVTVFPALYVIHLWIFMTIDTCQVCISPRKNWEVIHHQHNINTSQYATINCDTIPPLFTETSTTAE